MYCIWNISNISKYQVCAWLKLFLLRFSSYLSPFLGIGRSAADKVILEDLQSFLSFLLFWIQGKIENTLYSLCQTICNIFRVSTVYKSWNLVLEKHLWKHVRTRFSDELLQIML